MLVWRAQEWHHHGRGGYHLSQDDDRLALCGANVLGANIEIAPDIDACCSRCELLADLAGRKIPPTFRKRNEAGPGQGELL